MSAMPDKQTLQAWTHLVRAQQLLLERVEADLKAADLPPLRWYDVLLEVHRAAPAGIRQFEIGAAVLLSKHNLSRLLDRLENEKLLVRYTCETDGRGALVQITQKGHELLKQMWSVYGIAINTYFAEHFNKSELKSLATLLGRIMAVSKSGQNSMSAQ